MFGKKKAISEAIEKFNTNPRSEIVSSHYAERKKISTEIMKGLSPAMSAFSIEFILIVILKDGILFIDYELKNPKFVKRMFWNQIDEFSFTVESKTIGLLGWGKQIELNFLIDHQKYKTVLKNHEYKDSDTQMSEQTLSFLQDKINNKELYTKKEDTSTNESNSIADELLKLNNLKETGILSEEEFNEQKKKLLK
jgi:hypothetical protein